MTVNQQIISMERGQTANSGSPMWRCQTVEGERCNVFQHKDPKKNNFALFETAGYAEGMLSMELGEHVDWNTHPIEITLEKTSDGKWWEIVSVNPRPDGAIPDLNYSPDPLLHREAVEMWATAISASYEMPLVVLDTETTGLGDQDEIIDIAIVDLMGNTVFQSLIKPSHPELLTQAASELTGITAEMLVDAPDFATVYEELRTTLYGKIWLIYNAPFDTGKLDYCCNLANVPPLRPVAVTDVMERFAEWYGEWDAKRGEWMNKSLSFACECLDIFPDGAHRALSDARSTLLVINTIAEESSDSED